MCKRYSLAELENMETINQGYTDNMKYEKDGKRVWLSRMTVEDGMPYDNQVTVEELKEGRWETVDQYQAK